MLRRLRDEDRGFTLLEVMTTCILLGVLIGMAVMPWHSYRRAAAHKEASRELVTILRNAQAGAAAEGITYRVVMNNRTVTSYRGATGSDQRMTFTIQEPTVSFSAGTFTAPTGPTSTTEILFLPRGVASDGDVNVVRSGRSKVYVVSVEGLTSRVSYTE